MPKIELSKSQTLLNMTEAEHTIKNIMDIFSIYYSKTHEIYKKYRIDTKTASDYLKLTKEEQRFQVVVLPILQWLLEKKYDSSYEYILSFKNRSYLLNIFTVLKHEDLILCLDHMRKDFKKNFLESDIGKTLLEDFTNLILLMEDWQKSVNPMKAQLDEFLQIIKSNSQDNPGLYKTIRPSSIGQPSLISDHFIWVEKNNLNLFPINPFIIIENSLGWNLAENVFLSKIPFENIDYFSIEGEVIHENKISGGGGGGTSIGGAIVGQLLAGDVGAIIGSRKQVEPVKSELVNHDNRRTVLTYLDENNEKKDIFFTFEAYTKFKELIPEKSFEIVEALKKNKIIREETQVKNSPSIPDQIREFGKLRGDGLITEEEFQKMKSEILNSK